MDSEKKKPAATATDDKPKKSPVVSVHLGVSSLRKQVEDLFPDGVPKGTTVKITLPKQSEVTSKDSKE